MRALTLVTLGAGIVRCSTIETASLAASGRLPLPATTRAAATFAAGRRGGSFAAISRPGGHAALPHSSRARVCASGDCGGARVTHCYQPITRRYVLQGAASLLANSALPATVTVAHSNWRNPEVQYGQDTLPAGIRSRFVDNNNGVRMHLLEAAFENRGRPCVVLLHGFPELAYTWRNQLLP
jgi:hypothetical protein